MRSLAKSALTFPWAMSMFGVQQVANLVSAARSEGRLAEMTASIDALTHATEQQLDGWTRQTYSVGSTVQRGLVDTMMMRPPAFDSSAVMRTMAEMQGQPLFKATLKYAMPPVGWIDSLRHPKVDAPAVFQEFSNKLYIIQLVTAVHADFGLDDPSVDQSVVALVDRAANKETFPRLWVAEGIGNYIGDHAMEHSAGADPEGLLNGRSAAELPPWSLTMLHAGVGMSFAKAILKGLGPSTSTDVLRAAIARFVALCSNSSRRGYAGAALESLGLATRTLYPNLVSMLDREIPHVDEGLQAYFWHGAGRAMYFDPMNMLPSANAPARAIAKLEAEAPHDLAYRNALSGLSWAITVVNMRNPEVMEAFLRHHGTLLAQHDAFANGVTSSLMMRYDTTRDDANIDPFIYHEAADPAVAPWWRTLITAPCEKALQTTYGELQRKQALEELFRYRPGSI
jgi:hypothetical protein